MLGLTVHPEWLRHSGLRTRSPVKAVAIAAIPQGTS
jgi:hypothetical protein